MGAKPKRDFESITAECRNSMASEKYVKIGAEVPRE